MVGDEGEECIVGDVVFFELFEDVGDFGVYGVDWVVVLGVYVFDVGLFVDFDFVEVFFGR